jgi:anti-anti-sigma factor
MDEVTYFLRGEVDISNADALLDEIRRRAAARTGSVVVDCMDLEFIGGAGLGALAVADYELRAQGRRLLLLNAMPMLVKLLDICGLTDMVASTATSSTRSPSRTRAGS